MTEKTCFESFVFVGLSLRHDVDQNKWNICNQDTSVSIVLYSSITNYLHVFARLFSTTDSNTLYDTYI